MNLFKKLNPESKEIFLDPVIQPVKNASSCQPHSTIVLMNPRYALEVEFSCIDWKEKNKAGTLIRLQKNLAEENHSLGSRTKSKMMPVPNHHDINAINDGSTMRLENSRIFEQFDSLND